MLSRLDSLVPLRILALRGIVGFAMLKTLLVIVAALVSAFLGPGAIDLESPAGTILLTTVLGAVDIRRRGESLLWANLGYPGAVTLAPFAAAAVVGESLLALLAR